MTGRSTAMVAVGLVLAACGGPGQDESTSDASSNGGDIEDASSEADGDLGDGGEVVDRQPPGQATVSVDGQEWTLTEPGAAECSITADEIRFSFRIGDNEVTLGGGANLYDNEWVGIIDLTVPDPEGGEGQASYFPDATAIAAGIAIDGDSMSYSGPMQMQPPNYGDLPEPEPVGDGTVSVTCG